MNLKEFGIYFTDLRINSGCESQRQLAEASGVSNGTIARIEDGSQKATPETLKRLAPFLKVSYDELMQRIGYVSDVNLEVSDLSSEEIEEVTKFINYLRWKRS